MNLPEGALRLHLENLLTKAVPNFDDLALLHVTGQSHIGCLGYGTPGSEIDAPHAAVSVQEICSVISLSDSHFFPAYLGFNQKFSFAALRG